MSRCHEPYTGGYHSWWCIRDDDGTHLGDGCTACGEQEQCDEVNCQMSADRKAFDELRRYEDELGIKY